MNFDIFIIVASLLLISTISYYIILPRITELKGVFKWNLSGTLPIIVLNICSFFFVTFEIKFTLIVNIASSFVLFFIILVNIAYLIFSIKKKANEYIIGNLFMCIATGAYWVMQVQVLFVLYLIVFVGSPAR